MAKQLLALCSSKKITTRDGQVGPLGRVWLPFFGYWFANGQQLTEDNVAAQIPQDASTTMTGQIKPDVYRKDCCEGCQP